MHYQGQGHQVQGLLALSMAWTPATRSTGLEMTGTAGLGVFVAEE